MTAVWHNTFSARSNAKNCERGVTLSRHSVYTRVIVLSCYEDELANSLTKASNRRDQAFEECV
jgi:hypothetical protein